MAARPEIFPGVTGFQWDEGNFEKNWHRHRVTQAEAEQVFFNRPVLVSSAPKHSAVEVRYFALGEQMPAGNSRSPSRFVARRCA